MATCPECHHAIKETVMQGRKLIAQVNTGPYAGSGRYLTVVSKKCACGVKIERRYENRPMMSAVY